MARDDKDNKRVVPHGKDLKSLAAAINKEFGANITNVVSESDTINTGPVYKYSTGILSLDKYLGVGGLLGGRIVNLWGWEGTGKTLSALTMAAKLQQQKIKPTPFNPEGKCRVAFLDAEGTFSPPMARAVGVNTEDMLLFYSTPEKILTGEDYFAIMNILIQNGIEFIITDSAPALLPDSRLSATVGQGQKATQAQLMSEGLQQITTLLNAYKTSVMLFINQVRTKPMVKFGSPEEHTGGNALKFYASYSIEVKKIDDIVKRVPDRAGGYEDRRIGVSIRARLHKNKTATIPMDAIEYDIYFETVTDKDGVQYQAGVDVYKDIANTALLSGVVKQNSSWFTYGDIKANGMDSLISQLRQGGEPLLEKIRADVLGITE